MGPLGQLSSGDSYLGSAVPCWRANLVLGSWMAPRYAIPRIISLEEDYWLPCTLGVSSFSHHLRLRGRNTMVCMRGAGIKYTQWPLDW